MAANTAVVSSSVITSTSQHKRDFSERIRRLYPDLTKMLALVDGSNLDAFGKPAYNGKGMIKKVEATRMDPEWSTLSPIEVMYLCTGGSATTALIADTSFFGTGDKIVNATNSEVAIVNTITDGNTLTVTAVTGSTWTGPNAGDYIIMISNSYEEGTSRYSTITNELTVNKTYLHIFREGIGIADTVRNTPQYTNEGMFERYMTDKTFQSLRKLEGSFLFSKQATAGTTTVTIGGTAYPLYSMQGLLNYAGSATSMGGAFNWENWNTVIYPQMPKTMISDETIYMICGRKIAATMNQWAQNSYLTMGTNTGDKFGKTTKTFIMGGQLEVELLVHDLFDQGGYSNQTVFFQNSDIVYRFMKGLDLKVRENAQLPSAMAKVDIVEGVVGLQSYSNGANIKWFSNLLAA